MSLRTDRYGNGNNIPASLPHSSGNREKPVDKNGVVGIAKNIFNAIFCVHNPIKGLLIHGTGYFVTLGVFYYLAEDRSTFEEFKTGGLPAVSAKVACLALNAVCGFGAAINALEINHRP